MILLTSVENQCEASGLLPNLTRAEAFDMLVQHAADIGANAIVGVRYDATEVLQGVTEVLCYGTAVVVEPIADAD